jgi:hypothetical protein
LCRSQRKGSLLVFWFWVQLLECLLLEDHLREVHWLPGDSFPLTLQGEDHPPDTHSREVFLAEDHRRNLVNAHKVLLTRQHRVAAHQLEDKLGHHVDSIGGLLVMMSLGRRQEMVVVDGQLMADT